jgi:hypothetical protein
LTLEEFIESRCSSRPDRQNIDRSCVDIACSTVNLGSFDRSSDADWNVI